MGEETQTAARADLGAESMYQGRSARAWAREIRHWEVAFFSRTTRVGSWALWVRQPPFWARWMERLGFPAKRDWSKLPLLDGDPAAVPVLLELLQFPEKKSRLIAVQGLDKIGEAAKCAVPALLAMVADREKQVRSAVAKALCHIDRAAAEKAGLTKGPEDTLPEK